MKNLRRFMECTATAISLLIMTGCDGKGTGETAPRQPQRQECDLPCIQNKVNLYLGMMGEFDNEKELQGSLRELVSLGPQVADVVLNTYQNWSKPGVADRRQVARPAEMRWRAVHLLGDLGQAGSIRPIYEIAALALPTAKDNEFGYADEYRIRLRAIVGLQKLKAVDELKRLHAQAGPLKNATATSLFELGLNVGGVSRTDVRTALAEDQADPKDYNPNRGRIAQRTKPRIEGKLDIKRREDTPATGMEDRSTTSETNQ
jgi:hypothetical protein